MKELNDLNAIYLKMHEQEVTENQDKGYVVTKADKKGNTKAWQGYKAGVKSKTTGKPLYRAADHLKNEEVEVDESIGSAIDKGLSAGADVAKVAGKAAVGGVKVASKVVKKTAGAAGRVAGTAIGAAKSAKKGFQSGSQAESVEIQSLINSGIFSEEELNLFVWNEFEESREYSHNPEKYHDSEGHDKKLERDKPYRKRSKAARMADPERGINSPAFRKFMADRGM